MRLEILLLAAATVQAGVIRGVTMEHVSGLPLARSVVRLIPVPNSSGKAMTQRTGSAGVFAFAGVPDGIYILAATREGYFQAAYGQRRPDGQGLPIEVNSDTDLFVDLRLFHKGALTGRVLDENGVGMENIPVIAYRARLPLRSEGRGVTDDRGVYRIHGLMPGKYWVRSAPATLEDGSGRLPTFGREAPETKDAFQHRVRLDEDTSFADVRPFTGNLFHLRGRVDCVGGAVQITLSSETMHRTIQGACGAPYDFEGLSPGLYQVLAANESIGGFIEIAVANTTDAAIVPALDLPHVDFPTTRRGAGPANIPVTIFARRVDLSEAGKLEELRTRNLLPGHWEMTAAVGPDQYVEMIENEFTARRGLGQPKPADAFDVFIETGRPARVRVTISDKAGHLDGSVKQETKSVAGAPVFLWPESDAARRSLGGFRETLADVNGKFRFDGLPPGNYRLLATFDMSEVDEEAIEEGHAITVTVQASQTNSVEVPLWVAP
jgi:protocatechuate 3,4-dioxygenase beta subunit